MSMDKAQARPARVIVVGNEKGGSGKSTVAMHVAVALVKARQKIATIDLDIPAAKLDALRREPARVGRAHRRAISRARSISVSRPPVRGEIEACAAFVDAVDALAQSHSFIVIDTPGHDGSLSRLAHSMADTLITPLNDSFVDFDVLGTVDPETFAVSDISHYAKMVQEVRRQREQHDGGSIDWLVMRNRLSMLGTRNKRLVGVALQELSRRLDFRAIEGFAERMIFREFYPRGLTALDDFDEVTLGTRPDHVACHGAAGGGEPAEQHQSRIADGDGGDAAGRSRHPTATATRLDRDGTARNAVPDSLSGGQRREARRQTCELRGLYDAPDCNLRGMALQRLREGPVNERDHRRCRLPGLGSGRRGRRPWGIPKAISR